MIGPNHNGHKPSPFQRAAAQKRRLKMLLYGPSGSGKTTFALQFPKPCVIDLEQGTVMYGEKAEFDVFSATSFKEIRSALAFLSQNPGRYETLIIDPITVAWEMTQTEWTEVFHLRNKKSAGHKVEFYTLQPGDWGLIKSDWKDFIRDLLALPMHVVLISREKAQYADGAYMVKTGVTFDSEKSLEYYFDLVVRTEKNYRAKVEKNRSLPVPAEFSLSQWVIFQNLLGRINVQPKAPAPVQAVIPEQPVEIPQAETIPVPPPPASQENFNFGDINFLHHKIGFKSTGDITWLGLANDVDMPNGKRGKQYLHQLAAWEDKPDIAQKAKTVLAAIESKGRNHYQAELEDTPEERKPAVSALLPVPEAEMPSESEKVSARFQLSRTGEMTWGDLMRGEKFPEGTCGREYLERLANWDARPDVSAVAKHFLEKSKI